MSSHLRRTWMVIVALLALAPTVAAASGWQRIELPIDADWRLVAAVFRDTLFVGGDADSGQSALCAIPRKSAIGDVRATACRIPPELHINNIKSLVSTGDSLIALCGVDTDDTLNVWKLFVYDGRWRRFPLMPDGHSYLFSDLHVAGRTLCATGYFRSGDRGLRESVLSWAGDWWQPLGIQLSLAHRCRLVELGCDLVAVVNKADSELDDDWLRRQFHWQQVLAWDGIHWRTLFTGSGGRLGSPVVHQGVLCLGQTPSGNDEGEAATVVRLEDGELQPLGDQFGLSDGRDARVDHLVVYRGRLVAAGLFDHVGDVSVDNIAFWDDEAWRALGTCGEDVGQDFVVADEQGLWRGSHRVVTEQETRPAALFHWAGPLPEDVTPAKYVPPATAAPVSPAIADTLSPFHNGDFALWQDDVPVGWKLWGKIRENGEDALHRLTARPGGGIIMRPDPACESRMTLGQGFRVEPGRFYRMRIRSHHTRRADADLTRPASLVLLSFSVGDRYESLFLSDKVDANDEMTLLASDGARTGGVTISCSRLIETLEIVEIIVEEVSLGFGDCFNLLAVEIDAFYTFPYVSRAEWNETVAKLRPAARRAVNSEAFGNILMNALGSLHDPEIRTVTSGWEITKIGHVYSGEDIPPPSPSSGRDPGPDERLLRLPCGTNIIYRSW